MKWDDEYWLPLMQVFMAKPMGVKPIYSRRMVELALTLHLPPQLLFKKMFELRALSTPRLQRLWDKYAGHPDRLAKGVRLWQRMRGFNNAEEFFDGVETCESFELEFRPVEGRSDITPMMLIIVLDLYFRLTPITMNAKTPEVAEAAKMMKMPAATIVEILDTFQICDPLLHRQTEADGNLTAACTEIWNRYGNENPDDLSAKASLMAEYFKS